MEADTTDAAIVVLNIFGFFGRVGFQPARVTFSKYGFGFVGFFGFYAARMIYDGV